MKAIIFTQYGSPDGLQLCEIPTPTPKDDELLIEVHASSVNSWDWEFLNGVPFINRLMFGLLRPKPGKQVPGADIAGTVKAVGGQVTRFQPGDEVFEVHRPVAMKTLSLVSVDRGTPSSLISKSTFQLSHAV